jgi:hypothetical protein
MQASSLIALVLQVICQASFKLLDGTADGSLANGTELPLVILPRNLREDDGRVISHFGEPVQRKATNFLEEEEKKAARET